MRSTATLWHHAGGRPPSGAPALGAHRKALGGLDVDPAVARRGSNGSCRGMSRARIRTHIGATGPYGCEEAGVSDTHWRHRLGTLGLGVPTHTLRRQRLLSCGSEPRAPIRNGASLCRDWLCRDGLCPCRIRPVVNQTRANVGLIWAGIVPKPAKFFWGGSLSSALMWQVSPCLPSSCAGLALERCFAKLRAPSGSDPMHVLNTVEPQSIPTVASW